MSFSVVRIFKKHTKGSQGRSNEPAVDHIHHGPLAMSNVPTTDTSALVQQMQGVVIGTSNGPILSNNTVTTINHYHQPQETAPIGAPSKFDHSDHTMVKLGDIILKSELEILFNGRPSDIDPNSKVESVVEIDKIVSYSARLMSRPSLDMLIHKYEGAAVQQLRPDFGIYSRVRHPNILQLYGLCQSPVFQGLIFHSVGRLSRSQNFHTGLSGFNFIKYPAKLTGQFNSVFDVLSHHGVEPATLGSFGTMVDSAGNLVVDRFRRRSVSLRNDYEWPFVVRMSSDAAYDFKSLRFHKSRLLEYYAILQDVCSNQQHPGFQFAELSDPSRRLFKKRLEKIKVLLYHDTTSIPSHALPRSHFCLSFVASPGAHSIVVEGLTLTILPNMGIRCTIPIACMSPDLRISTKLHVRSKTVTSPIDGVPYLFSVWASQAGSISRAFGLDVSEIHATLTNQVTFLCLSSYEGPGDSMSRLHSKKLLYLFCSHTSLAYDNHATYWSLDPHGQDVIEAEEVQEAFGIHIHASMRWLYLRVPFNVYPILRDLHQACGFDPGSTDIATYLQLPLLQPVVHPQDSRLEDVNSDSEGSDSESDSTDEESGSSKEHSEGDTDDSDSENESDDMFLSAEE
ncbi:hypothetical protein C8J56DRAFT_1162434 [Mycena floridula]|nr:hypothetical protein C8J56DRAFT_1162434 [Mycena floridula]